MAWFMGLLVLVFLVAALSAAAYVAGVLLHDERREQRASPENELGAWFYKELQPLEMDELQAHHVSQELVRYTLATAKRRGIPPSIAKLRVWDLMRRSYGSEYRSMWLFERALNEGFGYLDASGMRLLLTSLFRRMSAESGTNEVLYMASIKLLSLYAESLRELDDVRRQVAEKPKVINSALWFLRDPINADISAVKTAVFYAVLAAKQDLWASHIQLFFEVFGKENAEVRAFCTLLEHMLLTKEMMQLFREHPGSLVLAASQPVLGELKQVPRQDRALALQRQVAAMRAPINVDDEPEPVESVDDSVSGGTTSTTEERKRAAY